MTTERIKSLIISVITEGQFKGRLGNGVGSGVKSEQLGLRWDLAHRWSSVPVGADVVLSGPEFQVDFSVKCAQLNSVLPRGRNILLALLTGVS